MIIVCQTFLKNTKIKGIALFPFILLNDKLCKQDKIFINHEKIHLRQQIELLLIVFYLWYVIEYYYWLIKLRNPYLAYRNISFEREAYDNENNLEYLKSRKFWTFLNYVNK